MPRGGLGKRFSVRTLRSHVCGHEFEAVVLPKSSGRQTEDITRYEAQPCIECRSAATRAAWQRTCEEA